MFFKKQHQPYTFGAGDPVWYFYGGSICRGTVRDALPDGYIVEFDGRWDRRWICHVTLQRADKDLRLRTVE